jgi:hypothetical protein
MLCLEVEQWLCSIAANLQVRNGYDQIESCTRTSIMLNETQIQSYWRGRRMYDRSGRIPPRSGCEWLTFTAIRGLAQVTDRPALDARNAHRCISTAGPKCRRALKLEATAKSETRGIALASLCSHLFFILTRCGSLSRPLYAHLKTDTEIVPV